MSNTDELQQRLEAANHELEQLRNNTQRNEIARVNVKNVPFLAEQPDLYFMQIEAQFRTAGVSVDQTKYDIAISLFEPKHLGKISDFLRAPPTINIYNAFKARILQEFTDSDQKKLRKLLEGIELGDDKPSQLLKKMKDLAGASLTDEAIKTLFVQRLPETVRGIISIAEGDSTVWAKQADKMMETAQFSTVSTVSAKPTVSAVNQGNPMQIEIAALCKRIAELESTRGRNNDHKKDNKNGQQRDRSQSGSRKEKDKNNKVCYYHIKFGEEARKCAEPCCFAKLVKKPSEN